jgi:hypothetical protein
MVLLISDYQQGEWTFLYRASGGQLSVTDELIWFWTTDNVGSFVVG